MINNHTEAPVFVVGMPRSGTTLIEQILASHSHVHGAGERFDLDLLVNASSPEIPNDFPESFSQLGEEQRQAMGASYQATVVDSGPTADKVVDKMPDNFRYLGVIATILPNARIVHLQRQPVDTCISCFTHRFQNAHKYSYDLYELGRYYRAYHQLMAHWRDALPKGMMLDVQYETLIAEPQATVEALLEHCRLDWEEACLNFHQTARAVPTASLAQVRQPLYRGSIDRWKVYEKHLTPLFEALGDLAPELG